ncbi:hypothetical protein PGT21_000552 [Puccinia graminis f. sp. tritici]|uniref:Uncharacterized protein n=1 Tax=Puccinia graminis f. sp. tritici TaxID=56615 RepID=A0A5B0PRC0_PUCGR|nr:hypothetical protein PGTUg99_000899 [Puccinia graminis f. sp. tritici]KAA1103801.1 hypothetical protein PGT21_000552 [Puccinia graminis f. sp. tritici]KAA1132317.1 hypothetical protein PGTUg99_007536 [Puccinia graminis f. sp. tritici]
MDDDYQRMRSLDNGTCANPTPHFTGFTDSEETCGSSGRPAHEHWGAKLRQSTDGPIRLPKVIGDGHNLDFFSVAVCKPYSPSALGSLKASSQAALLGRNWVWVLYWLMLKCTS